MGVIRNNRTKIVAGGLISASYISDVYNVLTGNSIEDISITGSLSVTGSMYGNLIGTSSYATTASYTLINSIASSSNADFAISSSYAISASYAVSASYEINYETSSSYAESATSSSYALTASYALNASAGTIDLTNPEVVLVNATGSVPDDGNANYSLTVPLGFSTAPNKVLAILTTDNFSNTNNTSFNGGTGWGLGVAGPGTFIQNVSDKLDSSIRFVVSSDYTQTFRAQDVSNGFGNAVEYNQDDGVVPTGSPLRYSESTTLLGVVGYFGTYVGVGYQSGFNNIQTHSVMQSAYLDGNNLVILMKKRTPTVGETLSRFRFRVYKLS